MCPEGSGNILFTIAAQETTGRRWFLCTRAGDLSPSTDPGLLAGVVVLVIVLVLAAVCILVVLLILQR